MAESADLTCAELVELVTDYLEGSLEPDEQDRFERHVEMCEGCAIFLDQIRTTVRLTGRLTEDKLSPSARDILLDAFRDWCD